MLGNNSANTQQQAQQQQTNQLGGVQMKQAATNSSGMLGASSSHHMHSATTAVASTPLNLTLKNMMHPSANDRSATHQLSTPAVQLNTPTGGANNVAGGDMHCSGSVATSGTAGVGSSNGGKHLFRKPQGVHIMPPTHVSIRNLTFHQMNKNSHCNSNTFNANGVLPTK